ncbi:MAG TPA: hypothetical protein VJV79_39375, partial [Polyangiaceae bacterium]|nr:hypothetical protein [Polyangiaceae bacterium]
MTNRHCFSHFGLSTLSHIGFVLAVVACDSGDKTPSGTAGAAAVAGGASASSGAPGHSAGAIGSSAGTSTGAAGASGGVP